MEKRKILVVDDDESVLEYLQKALEITGYEVAVASTATEAIGKLKTSGGGYPVVLTDIMMPGVSGLDLLHIVKQDYPNIMVIMLTAHVSMESAIKSLNEGAFAYLTKPENIDEMKATVKNAFEKYDLVIQNKQLMENLRKSKEYSESIVENLVHTVLATDENGCIKRINRAMEKLLGYKEEELVGVPLQSVFGKDIQKSPWPEMKKGNRVENFPITFKKKDGSEVKLLFTGTVMKDANGQVVGFLGMTRGE